MGLKGFEPLTSGWLRRAQIFPCTRPRHIRPVLRQAKLQTHEKNKTNKTNLPKIKNFMNRRYFEYQDLLPRPRILLRKKYSKELVTEKFPVHINAKKLGCGILTDHRKHGFKFI